MPKPSLCLPAQFPPPPENGTAARIYRISLPAVHGQILCHSSLSAHRERDPPAHQLSHVLPSYNRQVFKPHSRTLLSSCHVSSQSRHPLHRAASTNVAASHPTARRRASCSTLEAARRARDQEHRRAGPCAPAGRARGTDPGGRRRPHNSSMSSPSSSSPPSSCLEGRAAGFPFGRTLTGVQAPDGIAHRSFSL